MILDDPESHFIFVYHPEIFQGRIYTIYEGRPMTNGEIIEYWGKWIILGEKSWLATLAKELDPYVEQEEIPAVKYDREPPVNLGIEECVMMVYCDKRKSEAVWDILQRHGVKLKAWVSERETMQMWLPGGPLLERFLQSKGMDAETAKAVREDSRARLGHVFNNPHETFYPWPQ